MTNPMNAHDMHALVDDCLPNEQRQALEEQAMADPQTRETIVAWRKQREGMRALHRAVLEEPVPLAMLQASARLSALQQEARSGWRMAGLAAGVVLAFGLGWVSHGQVVSNPSSIASLGKGMVQHEFVRQAGFAHSVYLPEKRHPVEVGAGEQEHLVQWLSKRVGRSLKLPNLSAQGFDLVGGRLLPGDTGARAQFMFQNPEGHRITLYLGVVDQKAMKPTNTDNTANVDSANPRETRFRFEPNAAVPSFYWFDQGFGYALAGQIDREKLMQLATLVYQQL
jgi:anti-sigma factor RsiW